MSGSIDLAAQPFPRLMDVEVTEASKAAVRSRLTVRPELCTAAQVQRC